jgi:hypothetical protein
MATSQRERSQHNPLNLGTFSQTSLRLLIGNLGPQSQIIQGGYGNYTYDHWFQITLDSAAWIIAIKAGSKLGTENIVPATNSGYATNRRYQIAIYDQNRNPIQQRNINEKGSGYWAHVAGAQSDLYNTFDGARADKGNEVYYPLEAGNYLLCVSATRNELMTYGVGLVIEFPTKGEDFIITEDSTEAFVVQENTSTDPENIFEPITSPVTSDVTVDSISAFTPDFCTITNGNFVQVNFDNPTQGNLLTWYIGPNFVLSPDKSDRIYLDATENWEFTTHEHNLNEWIDAWSRENLGSFPDFFRQYALE